MLQIRLSKGAWSYDADKPLGPPGGFGAVFEGTDSDGRTVAVKRLHLDASEAAHRELTIARDLVDRTLNHVMPVLDAGQDAESQNYFVIMPVADGSLQARLDEKGPVAVREATDILIQIVDGLCEVPHVVHRDLKPGNVLLYEGRWCIADFGIARFVEETTSARTLKECLSPQYAGPEQWRLERATAATDAYALGCIGYALLTGSPPFSGTAAQLQQQHLEAAPPDLPEASPQMWTLLAMLLRKPPESRPSLARVLAILGQIRAAGEATSTDPSDPHLIRLASAAAQHERQQATRVALEEERKGLIRRRNELAIAARSILLDIFSQLARHIVGSVPNARANTRNGSHVIEVGPASLELSLDPSPHAYAQDAFPRSQWDVILGAAIEARQGSPSHKRAASLWYTNREDKNVDYRWYEVGYEANPLTDRSFAYQPAAVTPDLADGAHWQGMDIVQVCYPPTPVDGEDLDSFCKRWVFILAAACEGRLQSLPRGLPEVS